MINWQYLTEAIHLSEIHEASFQQPILIYKHSTRCSISSMVLYRLERAWDTDEMQMAQPYFLDLITYRTLSNEIAKVYNVRHESPQLLLISKGECKYDDSHGGINYLTLKDLVQAIYFS
ncbi:MAG: bacillithiol system redox-active protein YtxJ [Cyclobacteriaceae bacterium]